MKHLFSASCLALLLAAAPVAFAQDDEEGDLLKKVEGLLDGAKDLKLLEERQLLQDLDLKQLSNPDEMIEEAKAKLKELQSEGVIPIEAIRKVVEGGLEGDEENKGGLANGVLGKEPDKGVKKAADVAADWLTIENSNSTATDLDAGILVFDGDVMVTTQMEGSEEPMVLRCDRLTANLDENKELRSAIATGRMVVINGTNEKGEPVEARCQQAVFTREDKVVLSKWPEMSMQGRLIKAKDKSAKIEYGMTNGKIKQIGAFQISLKKKPESKE